jgi:hypothetical protein
MHRSGTTLMARSLEKSGIFMGVIKDHNFEAMHFLSLNQQTLWAAGGSWLEPLVPEPLYYKTLPARNLYEEHFKLVNRWQKLQHLLLPQAWGWKDPRNTFTLPMWLEIFPNAKVLHVIRDKNAVARSLIKRNHTMGEVKDERLNDIDFNLSLAERYQEQGMKYAASLGKNYHEIRYEQIIGLETKPIAELEKFTGRNLMDIFKYYVKS